MVIRQDVAILRDDHAGAEPAFDSTRDPLAALTARRLRGLLAEEAAEQVIGHLLIGGDHLRALFDADCDDGGHDALDDGSVGRAGDDRRHAGRSRDHCGRGIRGPQISAGLRGTPGSHRHDAGRDRGNGAFSEITLIHSWIFTSVI